MAQMSTKPKYEEFLPVGVIQTTVNATFAWPCEKGAIPKMSLT